MPIEEKPRESMHMERIHMFAPQAEARIMKGNTRAGSTITKYCDKSKLQLKREATDEERSPQMKDEAVVKLEMLSWHTP